MLILRELDKKFFDKQSVVTVGTFDGVHLGHREIIGDLNNIKNEKKLRSVIVTFDPHPQIVLKNKHPREIKILTTTEEKLKLFEMFGIDAVYIINFTLEFSRTSAENFYKDYLIDKIGLTDIVLGFDHNFGKNREGNYQTLSVFSGKYKFNIHRVDEFKVDGEHINSTIIRNLLYEGDIEKASWLLGDYYNLEGKIVYGDRRGRLIGFPTANIEPISQFKLIPKFGVYLVSVVIKNKKYFGMMNIGNRPTVSTGDKLFLEVNIFDFDDVIYDEIIKVKFIKYLRDEKKFDSIKDLTVQIKKDKDECFKKINNLIN
jgi:riboflavin kinase/FMN adenylyltransferase